MASSLSRLLGAARARLSAPAPPTDSRRQFFRKAGGVAAAAAGVGLLSPDDAWAGVEARANEFGIVPGTLVDAQGRRMKSRGVNPYLGEISLVGWNFTTRGWAQCEGQILPISQYSALFSLLGTTFGGDGRTTFGLPDLRGRAAIGMGQGPGLPDYRWGQMTGYPTHTMTMLDLPSHNHAQPVHNAAGSLTTAGGNIPAGDATGDTIYSPASAADSALSPTLPTGANQPFSIMQPSLAMSYQIAMQGVFPSRS